MNNKQELIRIQKEQREKLNALPFGNFMNQAAMQKRIVSNLGSERAQRFATAIVSAVNTNPNLAECANDTIYSAALLGESLNLSPSPQLGHYYLVPYYDKNRGQVAQFQLGYKGYIQLAIRSGQYKKLNVLAIKEGELINYNPLTEEIEVALIDDEEIREKTPTSGYYAMFEYTNGFRKAIYWSHAKMQEHAKKYSNAYRNDLKNGTAYTFWSKDFDGMAYKTMLRQLISKWGIMSIDMQTAYEKDMGAIKEDGTVDYIDNQPEPQTDAFTEPVPEASYKEKQQPTEENIMPKNMAKEDAPATKEMRQVTLNDL